MNTVYGLKNGWGNRVHINKNKNLLAVCTHKYYKEAKLASIELCIFSKIAKNTYKNYVETHTERGYEINIIKNKLKKAGFTKIRTYADRTLKKPGNKTARIWFCAVK